MQKKTFRGHHLTTTGADLTALDWHSAWVLAHRLARAHGHAWAEVPVPAADYGDGTWATTLRAESGAHVHPSLWEAWAHRAADEYCVSEGLPPSLTHRTGTGRLEWRVEPMHAGRMTFGQFRPEPAYEVDVPGGAKVVLTVHRPAGPVLRWTAAGIGRALRGVTEILGSAEERHWEALHRAALAAVGRSATPLHMPSPVGLYDYRVVQLPPESDASIRPSEASVRAVVADANFDVFEDVKVEIDADKGVMVAAPWGAPGLAATRNEAESRLVDWVNARPWLDLPRCSHGGAIVEVGDE